jgi:hypothetical protein
MQRPCIYIASAPSTARGSARSRVFHFILNNQRACTQAGPLRADPTAGRMGVLLLHFILHFILLLFRSIRILCWLGRLDIGVRCTSETRKSANGPGAGECLTTCGP